MKLSKDGRRWVLVAAVLAAAWAVTALWFVPWIIRKAYAGESLPILNAMISGQSQTSVDQYLAIWSRLAWRVTLVGPLLLAALVFSARQLKRIRGEHLLALMNLPPVTPAGALWSAALIGVISGTAEAVNGIVRHRVQHLPTGEVVSGELMWMAPLAATASLVLITLLLVGIGYATRRSEYVIRIAPPLSAALATFGLLRAMKVGIAPFAAVLLAVGAASMVARSLAANPRALERPARRWVPWVAGGLTVWALALPFWRRFQEGRALAALPPAAAEAPNVLILIWDTARARSLSLYGYERNTTPALERFAAGGAVFDRAMSTTSWSLPAHASIFTGRYPHELTAGRRLRLDGTHPTLAEVLARRGYVTGGFTANLFYGSADYGIARGFITYDSRPPIKPTVIASTWFISQSAFAAIRKRLGEQQTMMRRSARHVNGAFLDWASRHGSRPFFAVLNNFDAHQPYRAPAPFDTAFTPAPPRYAVEEFGYHYPPEMLAEFRDAYDTCLLYLDSELDLLLAALRERGTLDNTVVILTSDHGEEFGEYGPDLIIHGRTINYASLHVPLVMVYPKSVPAATRRSETVSIRDIPATVMSIVAPGEPHPFPGHSLVNYARGLVSPEVVAEPRLSIVERHSWAERDDTWPAALGHLFSVMSGDLHFVVDGRGKEHLYDIASDPWSRSNLVNDPGRAADVNRLRSALDSLVGPAGQRKFRATASAPAKQ